LLNKIERLWKKGKAIACQDQRSREGDRSEKEGTRREGEIGGRGEVVNEGLPP